MTRRYDRRQALGAFGTISLGSLLAACGDDSPTSSATTPVATTDGATTTVEPRTTTSSDTAALFEESASCTVTPEQTEGPYYFDADAVRSDIREDRKGTRLRLALRVRDAQSCQPLPDAVVDIWHCDAEGSYSGFDGASTQTRYLRGAQVTNKDGIAELVTIYPGWYQGRTVHIHAKVHLDSTTVLTTQLFFDDKVSDAVFARSPYNGRGRRDELNSTDGIFDDALVLTLAEEDGGYRGVMNFDVRQA